MAQPGNEQKYNGPPFNYPMAQQYPPPESVGYMIPEQMPPGQLPPGAMQQGYAMNYNYGPPPQGECPQLPMQYPPSGGYNPPPIINQPVGDDEREL